MTKYRALAALVVALFFAAPASAQTSVSPCTRNATGGCTPVTIAKPFPVNIISGGGSGGTAAVDEDAFTWGTTSFTPIGGFYQTTATSNALTTGQSGAWQFTAQRAGFVNLRDASGTELGLTTTPLFVQSKSGAFPSGTIADGAIVTLGTEADAAWPSGSGTVVSILKNIAGGIASPLAGVSTAQTTSAASSLVAKGAAGNVISISGSAVSGSYIMLFNTTSAPNDGSVTPLKCWGPMAAAGPFSLAWGVGPVLTMSTGITVVSSSTGCFTKTATNANFLSVEYQ